MLGKGQMARLNQASRTVPSAGSTVALELLSGCGMIAKANLRKLTRDGAGHRKLSRRVHYSLIILPNCLNLSGGSRV